jgi:hypothetical protein
MGAMAQVKDGSTLTPLKVNTTINQAKDYTLYPNSFNNFSPFSTVIYFSLNAS